MKTLTLTALSFLAVLTVATTATGFAQTGTSRPVTTEKPASPAATPVGTSGAATADYRLVAGDKLRIEVYKDTQLSQTLQVRPDGKITLPLVGDVAAAGKTSIQLRDAISASLEEYIANPVVTVIVTETTPQMVYVQGEVNKPGAFPLSGPMSIMQALALAGGFTDFANKKDIRILSASGVQRTKFNYKEALEEGNRRVPPQLQAGDVIVVR